MLTFQLIDGRQQVFQWETDRVIKLIGFESCEYVNFYNPFSDDEAYTVKPFTNADDICVVIPNEILQFDKKVRFYIVGSDEYGNYVQLDGVINLVPRQKPANYIYEPSDILTFQKVLDAAKAYRDEAEKSAEESKKSADTALIRIFLRSSALWITLHRISTWRKRTEACVRIRHCGNRAGRIGRGPIMIREFSSATA